MKLPSNSGLTKDAMCTVLFSRMDGAKAKAKGVSLSRLGCCVLRQRYLDCEAVMALVLREHASTRMWSTTRKIRCMLNEYNVKYDLEMMQAKTGLYPALDLKMTIILAQSCGYESRFTLHSNALRKMHMDRQRHHGCLGDSAVSGACIVHAWTAHSQEFGFYSRHDVVPV